jgi:hypothetical protein
LSDKQAIDDRIMDAVGEQTTLEQGAQGLVKTTKKLRKTIHEKEIRLGEIQNEGM